MSGIVLSASVRQNLLSLQSTAQLLATTQNNLSTGKKVNSALDNPTNFFTAQGLDNRASDISNLLDGIGNGVQVLQAANTGITSLQKLVDSAKSIANQVLQSSVGYSTKSSVTSTALTGATATDLLGSSSTAVTGSVVQNDNTTPAAITGSTKLSGTSGTASNNLATGITSGETLVVNGTTFTFVTGTSSTGTSIGIGDSVTNLLSAIQSQTGVTSSITAGAITLTPPAAGLTLSGSSGTLAKLGLTAVGDGLSGQTLTVGATGGGTATSITFGLGTGQVKSLNDLNTALAANNLQASIDSTGKITLTTTNDAASATIGTIGGTSAASSQAFNGLTAAAPVADTTAQTQRSNLVSQYNNVLTQINLTASDASFNGVNLLNGDTLKLTFNENGKSTLSITGVTFNSAGLGLTTLTSGTDFLDNNSANKVIGVLTTASSTLRNEASTLGSNLSVVQVRQDFNKNLINVLQTGSSNLTLADTNEEAANSQALSTRQSIAVSALSLANQSQASVLQLLR
ncbi:MULTISPECIES: flagellin [unclassified Bradyrhizobium]|uniref:flagellin N-terminal helical domain-containing protein n=1 Tax=unclassified Bradyrhizobium TaxID=2631580 RepID=UPI0028E90381|nr:MULTISPECIES: flagellin [unclassified Bradyrhizobium]